MNDTDVVTLTGTLQLPDTTPLGELKKIYDDWYPFIQDPDEDYFDLLDGSFELSDMLCQLPEMAAKIVKYGGELDCAYLEEIKCKAPESIKADIDKLLEDRSIEAFLEKQFPWELETEEDE